MNQEALLILRAANSLCQITIILVDKNNQEVQLLCAKTFHEPQCLVLHLIHGRLLTQQAMCEVPGHCQT